MYIYLTQDLTAARPIIQYFNNDQLFCDNILLSFLKRDFFDGKIIGNFVSSLISSDPTVRPLILKKMYHPDVPINL